MSGETRFHPLWKEAVETMRRAHESDPETFFSDMELVGMVGENLDSKPYAFALLALRDNLLVKHGLVLMRDRDRKGYRFANDEEKLHDESERLFRRSRNALVREMTVLYLVDAVNLSIEDQKLLMDKRRRTGVRLLSTAPRLARQLMKHVELDNRTVRQWTALIDHKEYEEE